MGSFKYGEYMIQLNLWDKQPKIKWNLLTVYGDAQEEGKIPFLSELSSFCSTSQEPFLIGGDFNSFIMLMKKVGTGVFISILVSSIL